MRAGWRTLAIVAPWSALLLAVALARPYFPVDETRYLAVAWESWQRADRVLLHLNGETYSHKPPLLFWLIHLGWGIAGVNDYWPRALMAVISTIAAILTWRLAGSLAPRRTLLATVAPLVAASTLLWSVFAAAVMFDLLLTCCVLVGLIGVVTAAGGRTLAGFLLLGIGAGLGVLAKGPAALIHLLPVAVLAPVWAERPPGGWGRWYAGVAGAVVLAAAIALAWAIPASIAGGERFARELFWGQSADRMVDSFAHRQPFWWYVPVLPLMLFPWPFWGRLWRGMRTLARSPSAARETDRTVRFALVWVLGALAVFSAISGKNFHYLIPELPAFGLLAACAIERAPASGRRPWLIPLIYAGFALGLAIAARQGALAGTELPAGARPVLLACAVAAFGCAALAWYAGGRENAPALIGSANIGIVFTGFVALVAAGGQAFDMKPVATHLAMIEARSRPIAHLGKYHGQFHFAGRLVRPLTVLGTSEVGPWAARHPDGVVVAYSRGEPIPGAQFSQRMRGRFVSVLPARTAASMRFE